MKWTVLVAVLVTIAVVSARPQEDKYTTKFDDMNVEEILQSGRLLKNYVNCFLDKGPCTPDGVEAKVHIPDALTTECSKCSPVQKEKGEVIFHFILKNHPDIWKQMEAKYDPEGTYRKKYLKFKDKLSPEEQAAIGV